MLLHTIPSLSDSLRISFGLTVNIFNTISIIIFLFKQKQKKKIPIYYFIQSMQSSLKAFLLPRRPQIDFWTCDI